MIITIDGPTGTGKSTIAKMLAEKLGFTYFDTGAMYRCLTWGLLKNKIDINQIEDLNHYLDSFEFAIKMIEGEKRYFVGDRDVTKEIRGKKVTHHVSTVAAVPAVREHLVEIQRKFGASGNVIFEGRDLGTVVFPNAQLKIFLTASPEVRAERRFKELQIKFPNEPHTYEEVLADINRRDTYDSTRKHSPLRQADGAHVVDSSHLSPEEVVEKIIKLNRV